MSSLKSIQSRLPRSVGGIVLRLRMVLMAIGVVIAFAGIASLWQTKAIWQAHAHLNQAALPLLAQARQSERDFVALFVALDRVSTVTGPDMLQNAHQEISEKVQRMHRQIDGLVGYNVDPVMVDKMRQNLDAAQDATSNVLSLRAAIWELGGIENAVNSDLQKGQSDSRAALKSLSFRNGGRIQQVLKSVRDDASDTPNLTEELFSDLLFNALTLNDISLRLDGLFEQARTARNLERGPPKIQLQEEMVNRLFDLTVLLSRMPKTSERVLLAQTVGQLQKMVVAPNGLFESYGSQQELVRELAKARAARAALITRISQTATALVTRALAEVDSSSMQLRHAITKLNYVLAVAFLLALAVTAATLFWIVERQINRRMKRLNDEVRETAAGDLEGQITVSGLDELGDMARALKIFKQNAVELRRSNTELEKFAYVAAHDLRSPLRAIRDLASWVQEDTETQFSAESTIYLDLLLARADRLNQMLSDLLDYALAGQLHAPPRPVDLDALVRQLVMESDPERNFNFHLELPDKPILTYETPLTQIISNLLSNAIKHHDSSTGSIRVSAEIQAAGLVLEVQDDGPGIDPQYHSQVFDLFQTLRPRDEVEGSGLGLAIVGKLAARFDGTVQLFSDPATCRGTCFVIRLPAQPSQEIISEQPHKIAA